MAAGYRCIGDLARKLLSAAGHGPAAVLAVAGSAPLTPAYRALRSASGPAATFIFATNAAREPASQRASGKAMLLPDGMSIARSARSSVSFSPGSTLTTDCPGRRWLAKACVGRGHSDRRADLHGAVSLMVVLPCRTESVIMSRRSGFKSSWAS